MKTYIYRLKNPDTKKVRYVGKTTNPKRRWHHHCSIKANEKQKSHRSSWLLSILREGKKPILEIIDTCQYKSWEEVEKYWIQYHKDMGCNLCNHSYGGGGILGVERSKETKEKISRNNARARKITKTVYRFNKKGEFIDSFENPTVASKETGVEANKIRRSCNKYYTVSGGFIWSYDRNDNRSSIKNTSKAKQVVCLDLDNNFIKEYESISSASRDLNLHTSNISKCCMGEAHTCGKLKWKYKSEYYE